MQCNVMQTGNIRSLGECSKRSKELSLIKHPADMTNNRKFTLLGDPALTLAFPNSKIQATQHE